MTQSMFEVAQIAADGLGTLRLLTLRQIEQMRIAITESLATVACKEVPKDEHDGIRQAMARHVAEMTLRKQYEAVLNSPSLLAEAVAFMLGGDATAANVSPRISPDTRPFAETAVLRSYGFVRDPDAAAASDEAEDGEDESPFEGESLGRIVRMMARLYRMSPDTIGDMTLEQVEAWLPKRGELQGMEAD